MTNVRITNNRGSEVLVSELPRVNGVYHLLSDGEFTNLKSHFEGFVRFREESNELEQNPSVISELPYSKNTQSWINKQFTLELLENHIKIQKTKTVLIIGAGNGWLCNKLALQGLECLGVDILYYKYDGLETIEIYDSEFTHVLMHPHEIDRIKSFFDLIVFENNLAYVKNPIETLTKAKDLLSPKGSVFLTGLSVYYSGEERERNRISEMQKYFSENYNHHINTYQTDMYLNRNFLKQISQIEFKIQHRPQIKNRLKRIIRQSVVICDAIYTKPN